MASLVVLGTDGHDYVDAIIQEELPHVWHRIDTIHIKRNIVERFGKYDTPYIFISQKESHFILAFLDPILKLFLTCFGKQYIVNLPLNSLQ